MMIIKVSHLFSIGSLYLNINLLLVVISGTSTFSSASDGNLTTPLLFEGACPGVLVSSISPASLVTSISSLRTALITFFKELLPPETLLSLLRTLRRDS